MFCFICLFFSNRSSLKAFWNGLWNCLLKVFKVFIIQFFLRFCSRYVLIRMICTYILWHRVCFLFFSLFFGGWGGWGVWVLFLSFAGVPGLDTEHSSWHYSSHWFFQFRAWINGERCVKKGIHLFSLPCKIGLGIFSCSFWWLKITTHLVYKSETDMRLGQIPLLIFLLSNILMLCVNLHAKHWPLVIGFLWMDVNARCDWDQNPFVVLPTY